MRDAVCVTRLEMLPDSPWKIWMMEAVSWFTCCGVRAANSGWKPLKMPVRSSAGAVRDDRNLRARSEGRARTSNPDTKLISCCPSRFA